MGSDEKSGIIKRIWNKTIFPDMIKERKERKAIERKNKKEEKILMQELRAEARKEALKELKPELIKQIKQQELDKLTGKDKQRKKQQFADAFKLGGSDSTDKIERMLGLGGRVQNNGPSQDKLNQILGNNQSSGISNDKILGAFKQNEQDDKNKKNKNNWI